MATMNLVINGEVSDLLQVGDQIYYSVPGTSGGFSTNESLSEIIHIGQCIGIQSSINTIYVDTGSANFTPPSSGAYIMFSKENSINSTDLIGYFSSVKIVNDSTEKAEIFSIGVDIDESSK